MIKRLDPTSPYPMYNHFVVTPDSFIVHTFQIQKVIEANLDAPYPIIASSKALRELVGPMLSMKNSHTLVKDYLAEHPDEGISKSF